MNAAETSSRRSRIRSERPIALGQRPDRPYGMIVFENVSKQYPDGTVGVDGLSFTAPSGQITVLVGPSGCGKTTSLRMINRLTDPTGGRILVGDEDVMAMNVVQLRRRMGYVIQNSGLFPHRTVIGNVASLPIMLGENKRAARERASELLDVVGLDASYARRYPWQLSGGQQQRVGVARALATDPPFMLMDEPFSAVDPIVRAQLQQEFLRIQSEVGKTIVMVTHDIEEALTLGDRIVMLRKGGELAQEGTPEQLLRNPADAFVADFVGRARGYGALGFFDDLPLDIQQPQTVRLGETPAPTDSPWFVAVDDAGAAKGWWRREDGEAARPEAVEHATIITNASSTLRDILDAALSSPNGQGILVGNDGRLRGVVSLEEVTRAIRATKET